MGQVKLGYQVGMQRDDVATVLLYDWDDTLLGVIAVAKGVDNRKIINDYVKTTFVHPELQSSAAHASLARKDTYRGEYPCEGPGVGATFPDGSANPGSKYALTNKLDYAFYGREKDTKYPYVNGWVTVEPLTMKDTWTTIGVGALTTGKPKTFDFLNDMINLPAGKSTVYVKAAYTPGTWLNGKSLVNSAYSATTTVEYNAYTMPTEKEGNYYIKFRYDRINAEGYGVARISNASLQAKLLPDAKDATAYYQEYVCESADKINVSITPSKGIKKIDYKMVETYENTFMGGSEKSKINAHGVFFNYSNGVGSDGFVKEATFAYISEILAAEMKVLDFSTAWATVNEATLNDIGLRTERGEYLNPANGDGAMAVYIYIYEAAKEAYANHGGELLDFYQMQYTIYKGAIDTGGSAGVYANKQTAYDWYWKDFRVNTYNPNAVLPY